MRRTASEVIRELQMRVARLERQASSYMRDDDMNRYASNLRLDRKDEMYIKKELGNPPNMEIFSARRISSRTNPHHGLKYELVELKYTDAFLNGTKRAYVIFEVDGGSRELMEVIESASKAEDRFDEYTD